MRSGPSQPQPQGYYLSVRTERNRISATRNRRLPLEWRNSEPVERGRMLGQLLARLPRLLPSWPSSVPSVTAPHVGLPYSLHPECRSRRSQFLVRRQPIRETYSSRLLRITEGKAEYYHRPLRAYLYSFGFVGAGAAGGGAFVGRGASAFARFCELVPLCSRALRRLLLLRLSPTTRVPLNGSLAIRLNSEIFVRGDSRPDAGQCKALVCDSLSKRVSKIQSCATKANHLRPN